MPVLVSMSIAPLDRGHPLVVASRFPRQTRNGGEVGCLEVPGASALFDRQIGCVQQRGGLLQLCVCDRGLGKEQPQLGDESIVLGSGSEAQRSLEIFGSRGRITPGGFVPRTGFVESGCSAGHVGVTERSESGVDEVVSAFGVADGPGGAGLGEAAAGLQHATSIFGRGLGAWLWLGARGGTRQAERELGCVGDDRGRGVRELVERCTKVDALGRQTVPPNLSNRLWFGEALGGAQRIARSDPISDELVDRPLCARPGLRGATVRRGFEACRELHTARRSPERL